MIPKGILLEPENTLYTYQPCHAAGMAAAHVFSGMSRSQFQKAYVAARQLVKERLGPLARNRILYFQTLVELQADWVDTERTLAYTNAYWDAYIDTIVLDSEAGKVLARLQQDGVKLAVVSNQSLAIQLRELQALGLRADALVIAEEVGMALPGSAVIDLVLEKLNLDLEEIWVVGLHKQKLIEASRAVNLFTVYLDGKKTERINPHEFSAAGWRGFGQMLVTMQPD